MQYFHTKLPCQKPILRQKGWEVQNGPITKNGVFPVTTLFFWKFCFIVRTSSKELIRCTNYPTVHIYTFCKRWSFIWKYFFPVSILKQLRAPKTYLKLHQASTTGRFAKIMNGFQMLTIFVIDSISDVWQSVENVANVLKTNLQSGIQGSNTIFPLGVYVTKRFCSQSFTRI